MNFSRESAREYLERLRAKFAERPTRDMFKISARVDLLQNHVMRATIRGGRFAIFSDEPAVLSGIECEGEDSAPAPLEYFVAGHALCEATQYLWQIADMDLDVNSMVLEVHTRNPWTPVLPDNYDVVPGLSNVEVRVSIETSEDPDRIDELARRAAKHCPAHQSLVRPVEISRKLTVNGQLVL